MKLIDVNELSDDTELTLDARIVFMNGCSNCETRELLDEYLNDKRKWPQNLKCVHCKANMKYGWR